MHYTSYLLQETTPRMLTTEQRANHDETRSTRENSAAGKPAETAA